MRSSLQTVKGGFLHLSMKCSPSWAESPCHSYQNAVCPWNSFSSCGYWVQQCRTQAGLMHAVWGPCTGWGEAGVLKQRRLTPRLIHNWNLQCVLSKGPWVQNPHRWGETPQKLGRIHFKLFEQNRDFGQRMDMRAQTKSEMRPQLRK